MKISKSYAIELNLHFIKKIHFNAMSRCRLRLCSFIPVYQRENFVDKARGCGKLISKRRLARHSSQT